MGYIMVLTFKEVVSKRVLLLGLLLTIIFIGLFATALHYMVGPPGISGDQAAFLSQQAGYQMLLLGWFCCNFLTGTMAILMGSGSISREIETGTILNLASRPLSRSSIVLGKYLAYTLLGLAYTMLLYGAILLMAWQQFQLHLSLGAALTGLLLFSLLPALLLALTTYCSTVFSTLTAGVCGFMVYSLAIIGGFMEQIGSIIQNATLIKLGIVSSLMLPTDAVYRLAVHSVLKGSPAASLFTGANPFGVVSLPSNLMLVYVFGYILLFVFLSLRQFSRCDL